MKGFEHKEDDSSMSVDNWTEQQCKDYLTKYPNGLKAENVRARLESLAKSPKELSVRDIILMVISTIILLAILLLAVTS